MTIKASGTLSMTDIVNEFGGKNSHSLSEYYRGGFYVPELTANNSIPRSGTIKFSDFYGTSSMPTVSHIKAVAMRNGDVTTLNLPSGDEKNIVILAGHFNAGSLGFLNSPDIRGIGTARAYIKGYSTYSNDGHTAAISRIHVGNSNSVVLTAKSDAFYSFYCVDNMRNLDSHVYNVQFNSCTQLDTRLGCSFVVSVKNWPTIGNSITNCDIVHRDGARACGCDLLTGNSTDLNYCVSSSAVITMGVNVRF